MTSKTLRLFLDYQHKAMADREKREENKNTKNWISQQGKELFR